VASLKPSFFWLGGYFFGWLLCLWIGVAVPMSALHVGQHLASLSPKNNQKRPLVPRADRPYLLAEASVVILYAGVTIALVLAPISATPSRVYLTFATIFGGIGCVLRFLLSKLNPKFTSFPIGTFAANVSGTIILAVVGVLSKFFVHYSDYTSLAILYGIGVGFCGCLTTISTFVNELDGLSKISTLNFYRYGILSMLLAQVGHFQAIPLNFIIASRYA